MTSQCPTCGGKLANYARVPIGYCTTHSNWFNTNLRCASATTNDCSNDWDSDDFGLVCPTDGTRIARNSDLDIAGLATAAGLSDIEHDKFKQIIKNHPDTYDVDSLITASSSEEFPGLLKRIVSTHDDLKCDKCVPMMSTAPSNAQKTKNEETGTWIVNPDTGAMARAGSVQKTAMWYYLKPRWILRRKMQAAVRRKVRSVLAPISAIKSSK